MSSQLIPASMLFRVMAPCRQTDQKWTSPGVELDERYGLPPLGQLDGVTEFAKVRFGWNASGLMFTVRVSGKRQSLWCRTTQLLESDGLQIWIDTRDTHNVHRASRFCHWFLFMPTGGGSRRDRPCGMMLKINRAKEDPRTLNQVEPKIKSDVNADGYTMRGCIPGKALTGWDPQEHPRLGFNYAVIDRELGWQTFGPGPEFPIAEDPSLWQTLELK